MDNGISDRIKNSLQSSPPTFSMLCDDDNVYFELLGSSEYAEYKAKVMDPFPTSKFILGRILKTSLYLKTILFF